MYSASRASCALLRSALEACPGLAPVLIDEGGEEVHHDDAVVLRDGLKHLVGHVASGLCERASGGVRGDDGRARGGDDVPEGLVGDVRDIDHHAEAVHLLNDLFAEGCESVVVGDGGVVDVAGGVGPVVGVGPGEGHVADAETVVVAQEAEVVLDGVAALDAHQDGELSALVCGEDLVGGEAELQLVGGFADLLKCAVDEREGAVRGLFRGVLAGVDPDGEELCVEVALLRGVVVQHAAVERIGEVPVLIDEALRRVRVGVDDDSGLVNCERICGLTHCLLSVGLFCAWGCLRGGIDFECR